ncbi:MAG: hypothetical protein F4Y24_10855 [Gemmatimonadetes bacterium]|nr:hypothetical protein [Gemmatimonadota bacterium]MYG20808.1 hypothetical protein [Gemmatimonadota bacterium]MYJ38063.1 hypothetical protein [Gemmatimonadota bacterium]
MQSRRLREDGGGQTRRRGHVFGTMIRLSAVLGLALACGDDGSTGPAIPVPARVVVSPAEVLLDTRGSTVQLTAEVLARNGQPMTGAAVTWSSGGIAVATADSTGLVTAMADGTVTVTATFGGITGTATVSVAATDSASTDRAALVALYEATGGPNWLNSNNWLTDAPLGEWFGVTTNHEGRVVALEMTYYDWDTGQWIDNNISGPIPPELGNLANLERMQFYANSLTGSIPPELGNLANLTLLDFNANDVSGPIPAELGELANLTTLTLYGNNLSGPIPPELGNLGNLTELWLGDNRLTGQVPSELGNLSGLVSLFLNDNILIGPIPPELGNLANLEHLDFRNNRLTGPIPPELGNLSRLEQLYVRNNRFSGSIPPELGHLTNLVRLELHSNRLSGSIPTSFLQLANLTDIEFARNDGLCAPGTREFVAWIQGINRADGPFCDVAALKQLFETAGGSEWTNSTGWLGDPVLADWYGIRTDSSGRVTEVDLSNNGLSGRLPAGIGELAYMTALGIAGNTDLAGRLPVSLSGLGLQTLHYSGTALCVPSYTSFRDWLGTIPSHDGTGAECPPLSDREILVMVYENTGGPGWRRRDNWLTDAPLADWHGVQVDASGRVERLYLDDNELSGSIPSTIGDLADLERLYLDDNELSGPIPSAIGHLASLERLRLNENELTGPIPPQLGDLASLTQLRMAVNQLSGRLPQELGNLAALEQMSLGANRLEGPIPPEFSGMANLTELEMGNNAGMTGQLPMSITGLRLNVLTAGGTDLCAPSDPDFQTWLEAVPSRRIKPCTEAEPPAAYLTQAVQSRQFPVPLVAGERALLRVFPIARQTTSEGIPPVRVRFYLNDRETHAVSIPAKPSPIPTEVNEASLSTSGNVEIPGNVVQPGLEMVVEIDPDGTLDPALGVAKRVPDAGRLTVEVAAMPPLDLTLIPLLWTENADSSIIGLIDDMAADPENHTMLSDIHTFLPVRDLAVTAHEPVLTATNNASDLLRLTSMIQAMEGGTGHYMGMMPRPPAVGSYGVAYVEGRASFSRPDAGTMAHELGHNLSLHHATRCDGGFDSDPSYPHPHGVTGAWGFDFRNGTLVPPTAWDLMAPGGCRPRLISDYSFTNALRFRLHDEPTAAAAVVRSLLVWGGISGNTVPFLEPVFVVDAPAALPDSTGEYLVVGRDVDGTELFSLSFSMPETADGDGSSSFAFVLPVQPHWEGSLSSVTLSGPAGSVALDQGSDHPMAVLRNRRNGQVRAILRDLPLQSQAALDAVGQATGSPLRVLFSRGIPGAEAWRR